MGRRSAHSPEELRELILTAAEDIIETGGLTELSAREIARRIEYSPGTLYNMFENLGDLVLHVEARVLTRLDQRLEEATDGLRGEEAIRKYANAYLEFSHERPRLWNLLFEHHMPVGSPMPDWYQKQLGAPLARLEREINCMGRGTDPTWGLRNARALWAAMHGVASLSTTRKVGHITMDCARGVLDELVGNYLAGLAATAA